MSAFGGKADMRQCPLMTQSGYRTVRRTATIAPPPMCAGFFPIISCICTLCVDAMGSHICARSRKP
jgi:hypothetical protein